MGIFNQKPKFKIATQTVRKIVVPVEAAKPKVEPRDSRPTAPGRSSASLAGKKKLSRSPQVSASPRDRSSLSPFPTHAAEKKSTGHSRDGDRKRKLVRGAVHRASPASDRVEFDKDSDTDDNDWEVTLSARGQRKRARLSEGEGTDLDRRLAHPALLETLADKEAPREKDAPVPDIVHAAAVACRTLKCVPVLGATAEEVSVELQYPGSQHREKYELVWGKDKIDAVKDIQTTIRYTAETYLTDEQATPFLDPTTGIVRQLERASSDKVKDVKMFTAALNDYNSRVLSLYRSGTIATNISQRHGMPRHLAAFILDQVYDRTVAPKVDLLRRYENGTDNVYGELLHPFITDILVDRLQMTSGQVFADLGSGVGNVVLQAALEIGCESWGCEMMENACNLAEVQKKEFTERCRLWGVAPGEVHLERGDFRCNTAIQEVVKRADVVLVNNQAFTSQLNDDLVRMFLDFKPGCKIVSLKSFVYDHKSSHNINDVGSTILDVEILTYPEGYVSWTGAAGRFCISTRR